MDPRLREDDRKKKSRVTRLRFSLLVIQDGCVLSEILHSAIRGSE